jgi:hypothetical protein
MTTTNRNSSIVLEDAIAAVRAHEDSYGSPSENFGRAAKIWSTILGTKLHHEITATDVGMMMIGLKLARLVHAPNHRDTQTDIAGYAALLSEVA